MQARAVLIARKILAKHFPMGFNPDIPGSYEKLMQVLAEHIVEGPTRR
jgi:hypothetical protein